MSSLSPERWKTISKVLGRAFDHPPGERAAYIAEACADDPELRREVESLLHAEASAPAFLDWQVPRSLRSLLLALVALGDRQLHRPRRRDPLRPGDIAEVRPMPRGSDRESRPPRY